MSSLFKTKLFKRSKKQRILLSELLFSWEDNFQFIFSCLSMQLSRWCSALIMVPSLRWQAGGGVTSLEDRITTSRIMSGKDGLDPRNRAKNKAEGFNKVLWLVILCSWMMTSILQMSAKRDDIAATEIISPFNWCETSPVILFIFHNPIIYCPLRRGEVQ